MPEYEITFASLLGAVKHHWKLLLLTLVLFSAAGAATGWLYADREAAEAAGGADALKPLSVTAKADDMDYYTAYRSALTQSADNAQIYLNALLGLPGLTDEETAALTARQTELTDFSKRVLAPISTKLSAVDAIYVPESCLPALTAQYQNSLASVQRELIAAEAAAEIIKNMDAPATENETILSYYNSLLSSAYNYPSYLRDQAAYTLRLERLENDADAIRADCRALEAMEDEAAQTLDRLTEALSALADTLAKEHCLQLQTDYNEAGTLSMTVLHTHADASAQDNFLLMWLFCTLCSLCVGAFLAVCREAGALPRRKRGANA